MTDKEKVIKELKEVLDNLDITNKYRLNLIDAIEYLQEEPAHCTGIGKPKEESGVLGEMIKEMKEEPILQNVYIEPIGVPAGVVELANVPDKKEKPVSEELEEAARKYAGIPEDSPHDLNYCVQDKKAKYDAVLFGAKWQNQQIMKDVVETKVVGIKKSILSGSYGCVEIKGDYKIGDRVNILILRED